LNKDNASLLTLLSVDSNCILFDLYFYLLNKDNASLLTLLSVDSNCIKKTLKSDYI